MKASTFRSALWMTSLGLAVLAGTSTVSSCASKPKGAESPAPVTPTTAMEPTVVPRTETPLPPDSEYVMVKDGHLTVDGKRQRYWTLIGKAFITPDFEENDSPELRQKKIDEARRGTDVLQQRFQDLGFNGSRMWEAVPNTESYQIGDGSPADSVDYYISEMKKRGSRIWAASLNRVGDARPDDVNIVNDEASKEEWKKAISEAGGEVSLRGSLARVWDPRLEALHIERMRQIADHKNKYTGLRWADDPVFAVWELSNEEWWMMKMVGGQWQKQPAFFRNQLVKNWNAWLKKKYGSEDKLKAAWNTLLPGENLEQGSVILTPMAGETPAGTSINDANPYAKEALTGLKQKYKREDFARARGADVLEYFLEIQLAHKERMAKAVKSWGKSTRLSPLVYDTGIGYEIQSQYMHQSADAVAHDAYVNGLGPVYKKPDLSKFKNETLRMREQLGAERISANAGIWVNWLTKPPGIAQGVPWLEHNRVEGKPFLAYETQIQQPAKYRVDYPLRLVALAAIQDWDWISWHYFSPEDDVGVDPRPFDKPMDITTGGHPQGYHFTYDEVQNSTMRGAAHIFKHALLKPAPKPTKFIFGRKSLYDPDSMDYAGSYGPKGMDMLQTVYQYGVRLQIDPTREDDEVIGPVVSFAQRNTHNPYTPTDEITFDWKKGFLRMQSPSVAAFTGSLAKYGESVEFSNGFALKGVTIKNPEGIFEPMKDNEKFIGFVAYTDGAALNQAKKIYLSLMSTSYNTGFDVKLEKPDDHKITAGTLPVLTARVGGTIEHESLKGMRYKFYDWHIKEIGSGTVEGPSLNIPNDKPVFFVELERP